ncbi:hypothetical protein [Acinetobacter baumannii]|uniref:Uncharacterized protein n=1 Tax=Acinetobacter baumannii TaxID=470 RepID=A0A335FE06_ACIBA|nr:hypothetical protein [Acinetobacter baumannii]SST19940.1 Uncharacterised protein [Acinetobacter baumannii]
MDINKTDMFEKFFNGFQEKFIEAFKAAGEEKILVRILENQKASKEEYRTYFNCAWEFLEKTAIAEQQAKVEEANAKTQMCRDEKNHAINRWSAVCKERDELQKRVDAALQLIPSIKAENDLWGCDQVERQIELLEQALKGEG